METFVPADRRDLSAAEPTSARSRRVRSSRPVSDIASSSASAVRASRSFRKLTHWPWFLAPNYSTHVPVNFRRNSHKTNDGCTHKVTLQSRRRVRHVGPGFNLAISDEVASLPFALIDPRELPGAPLTAGSRQFTRHTMSSKFHAKSLKTKERSSRQVHTIRAGVRAM